jgi:DNA-directed RNA polymerase specialized sigma24 family protein
MQSGGSVSRLIDGLVIRNEAAVEQLWKRYFPRLVGLARKKLANAPPLVGNEEDVALSALASLCLAAEQGRFPKLCDREGLWRLLVVITVRKAAHLIRDEARRPTSPLDAEELLSDEPSPEFVAMAAEEHQRLLNCLGDPLLKEVGRMRMDGSMVAEIAAAVGFNERTIKRQLKLIRDIWRSELEKEDSGEGTE